MDVEVDEVEGACDACGDPAPAGASECPGCGLGFGGDSGVETARNSVTVGFGRGAVELVSTPHDEAGRSTHEQVERAPSIQHGVAGSFRITLDEPTGAIIQRICKVTAGAPGYEVSIVGDHTVILTRTYRPRWATALAILGVFVFFVGLLFLLYMRQEKLVITLDRSADDVTVVEGEGPASSDMLARLDHVFGDQEPVDPDSLEASWWSENGAVL